MIRTIFFLYFLINAMIIKAQNYDSLADLSDGFMRQNLNKEINLPIPPVDTTAISIGFYEPIPPTGSEIAKAGLNRLNAFDAWQNGKYERVIDELNRLPKHNPIDLEFLTKAFIKLGRWQDALNTGQKIVTNNPQILTYIGIIAIINKEYKIALDYFKRAISVKADCDSAYLYSGNVFYLKDDMRNAIENWKAAKNYKNSAPYLDYFIGVAYFKLKDYESALKYFEYVTSDKDEWYYYSVYYLSYMAIMNKNIDQANEVLRSVKIFSSDTSLVKLDLLKKQIYCNYVLGLRALTKNEKKTAADYFIKAEYIIGSHSFKHPDYFYIDIIRGILIRITEEIKNEEHQGKSNLFFGNLITEIESYERKGIDLYENLKALANIIFTFSKSDLEKKLAAQCYQLILNKDIISENNFYCLNPSLISPFYMGRVESLECSKIKLYLLYNISRFLYLNKKNEESYDSIRNFKSCLDSVNDFKYKNEFLLRVLNLELKLIKEIDKTNPRDPRELNAMIIRINQDIAKLQKRKLKEIEAYDLINDINHLVAIYNGQI